MRKTIYETNYDRLIKLGVTTNEGAVPDQCRRSQVAGLMDWVVERSPHLDVVSGIDEGIPVSLAHYF